jgi:hypothetical protein
MGQFKPMVKMFTTEPSVELKLKKGGHVSMKAKKAEHGHKMMDGGVPPPAVGGGAPMGPAMAPKRRVSLPARRRAMMAMPAGAAPAAPVGMAGRMMKEGGESKAEHKAEMKKFSKLEGELKSHEGKPASKAHKGLATGGVVMGQGGFKKGGKVKKMAGGGIIPVSASESGAKGYVSTKMDTTHPDRSTAKTGSVKLGNGGGYKKGGKIRKMADGGTAYGSLEQINTGAKGLGGALGNISSSLGSGGGDSGVSASPIAKPGPGTMPLPGDILGVLGGGKVYKKGGSAKKYASGGSVNWENRPADTAKAGVTNTKTGEVRKGNAGGYKKGGAAKKAFATGGLVDDGRPVAMPQGNKKPPTPVSINQLSGTYKRGGSVKC